MPGCDDNFKEYIVKYLNEYDTKKIANMIYQEWIVFHKAARVLFNAYEIRYKENLWMQFT